MNLFSPARLINNVFILQDFLRKGEKFNLQTRVASVDFEESCKFEQE